MLHHATEIGHVAALYRYPVKSMRGEALQTSRVWWHGFEGDRRCAFLRSRAPEHFPWLTAREVPAMLLYVPHFDQPDDAVHSSITVTTPAGTILALADAALQQELAALAQDSIQLFQLGRGTFDSSAISLLSLATLDGLSALAQQPLDPQRFRPNILVKTHVAQPWIEDSWTSGRVRFGAAADAPQIRIIRPIPRCMIINLNPNTAVQEPAILRTVVKHHDQNAGVYGSPEKTGVIRVGDPVYLLAE